MLKKVLTVLSGNAAASLLLLARDLLVARLITVEDYGIAATFAMTMALIEMASQFGLQQQIVQAREGEDPRFQAVLQGFQVLRGVVAGLALFFLAAPIAGFLRVPEIAWAYQVMAVMPVLRALQHFDIHRLNRAMRFGPMLLTGVIPAALSLAAVYPLALWLGDWRVMLAALVLQEAIGALTSHLVAERRYQLGFDRAIMAQSLRFGWPLLLNGVLLFAVMQGDKLIVGRELGMAALGIFSMGVTLTLTPTLILAKTTQNIFLPQLSALAPGKDGSFDSLARATLQAAVLNGLLLVLAIFYLGKPLVAALLGDKFAALEPLLIWLAVQQGVRVFKSGTSTVALSCGATANAMIANLVRVAALPVIWGVVQQGGSLWAVIAIACAAEALGFCVALGLIRRKPGLAVRPMLPTLAVAVLVSVGALGLPAMGLGNASVTVNLAFGTAAAGLMLLAMKDLRTFARNHLRATGKPEAGE